MVVDRFCRIWLVGRLAGWLLRCWLGGKAPVTLKRVSVVNSLVCGTTACPCAPAVSTECLYVCVNVSCCVPLRRFAIFIRFSEGNISKRCTAVSNTDDDDDGNGDGDGGDSVACFLLPAAGCLARFCLSSPALSLFLFRSNKCNYCIYLFNIIIIFCSCRLHLVVP